MLVLHKTSDTLPSQSSLLWIFERKLTVLKWHHIVLPGCMYNFGLYYIPIVSCSRYALESGIGRLTPDSHFLFCVKQTISHAKHHPLWCYHKSNILNNVNTNKIMTKYTFLVENKFSPSVTHIPAAITKVITGDCLLSGDLPIVSGEGLFP